MQSSLENHAQNDVILVPCHEQIAVSDTLKTIFFVGDCHIQINIDLLLRVLYVNRVPQCTQHVSQCTQHGSQCNKHVSLCNKYVSQCTQHGSQCNKHVSQCNKHVSQCNKHVSQCNKYVSQCNKYVSQFTQHVPSFLYLSCIQMYVYTCIFVCICTYIHLFPSSIIVRVCWSNTLKTYV